MGNFKSESHVRYFNYKKISKDNKLSSGAEHFGKLGLKKVKISFFKICRAWFIYIQVREMHLIDDSVAVIESIILIIVW